MKRKIRIFVANKQTIEIMIFSRFFKEKRSDWKDSKQLLKSTTDLRLLPEQVIYVEGSYNARTNKIISKKHEEIYSKLKSSLSPIEFVYLPFVTKQLQDSTSLSYLLKYYFPNIKETIHFQDNIHSVLRTDIISPPFFSRLGYNKKINPGFFRYMRKDKDNLFVYEYFPFVGSRRSSILKQIDYYISSIFENQNIETPLISNEEEQEKPFPKDFFEKRIEKPQMDSNFSFFKKERERKSLSQSLFDDENDEKQTANPKSPTLPIRKKGHKEQLSIPKHELILQIKLDIQNLKELGFYELLIKELGSVLFEQDAKKIFQPSRLFMDEEFRIYLPDFNNTEIVMTPLPKTLFILFLRHPEGINLKSLIDYKKELLEIYKLLSYRETYFNMIESVNRICNPFEGSINEKLSRIKEAFLRKISMDTAKYYIVTGKRGMKKKIEIDRSLIDLPDAFNEIE